MALALQSLLGRDYLREPDFSPEEFLSIVDLAAHLKSEREAGRRYQALERKNIALIFEKPSTRTRAAFEIAARDLGANTTTFTPINSHVRTREAIEDTARVLDRLFDGILYRGFEQRQVECLASSATVPVWNGMTDTWHPTQMLGDILTIREQGTVELAAVKVAYLGNGRNNIANSLLVTLAMFGATVTVVCPESLTPEDPVVAEARSIASRTGAQVRITSDVADGVLGADFLYTDSWLSMHEEPDAWAGRLRQLGPYSVTREVMEQTNNSDAHLLHCLPAYYGGDSDFSRMMKIEHGINELEVTADVFDANANVIFDQAENRMHTIKALLVATLGGS